MATGLYIEKDMIFFFPVICVGNFDCVSPAGIFSLISSLYGNVCMLLIGVGSDKHSYTNGVKVKIIKWSVQHLGKGYVLP